MSRLPLLPPAPATACSRRFFIGSSMAALASSWLLPAAQAADGSGLQFWFIRHAESELNVPGARRTVPDAGMSYPLTRRGVEQSQTLVSRMRDLSIAKIYTSTHLRAVQTASALAHDHTITVQLAPEAAELDLGVTAESGADIRQVYESLVQQWLVAGNTHARHGEGESYADLQQRFLPFVRELMNRHALDSGVVVIVSHGATLGLMLPVLTGAMPPDFALRHPLPNTGIIKTELRDSRLHCLEWAGLPPSEFHSATADETDEDDAPTDATETAQDAASAAG